MKKELTAQYNARMDELRGFILPVIIFFAGSELILARIIGRTSSLHAGNQLLVSTYQLGILSSYVATILVIVGIVLTAIKLVSSKAHMERLLAALLVLVVGIVLTAYTMAFWVGVGLVAIIPILLVSLPRSQNRSLIIGFALMATAFVASGITVYSGELIVLGFLAEVLTVVSAVTIFLAFRKRGKIGRLGLVLSVSIPVLVLVVPHHLISIMPWIIRLISTYSLGYQLVLPIEAYAVGLGLYLYTIFRLKKGNLIRYGMLMVLFGGLAQWDTYTLLLTVLGISTIILSLRASKGIQGDSYIQISP